MGAGFLDLIDVSALGIHRDLKGFPAIGTLMTWKKSVVNQATGPTESNALKALSSTKPRLERQGLKQFSTKWRLTAGNTWSRLPTQVGTGLGGSLSFDKLRAELGVLAAEVARREVVADEMPCTFKHVPRFRKPLHGTLSGLLVFELDQGVPLEHHSQFDPFLRCQVNPRVGSISATQSFEVDATTFGKVFEGKPSRNTGILKRPGVRSVPHEGIFEGDVVMLSQPGDAPANKDAHPVKLQYLGGVLVRILPVQEHITEDSGYLGHTCQCEDESFLSLSEGDGFRLVLLGVFSRRVGLVSHVPKLVAMALS
jgi:hypothetical protein